MHFNPALDDYFSNAPKWREELEALRVMILDCGLAEERKWTIPCYTWRGKNIVTISGTKEFCSFAFFKGVLLRDEYGLLIKPGQHTQEGRYIRLKDIDQVMELEPILKAYIFEAIEIEKAGLKVPHKTTADYPIPEEFAKMLQGNPALKSAFTALTPGRQRAYLLYFAEAKQSKTRIARIEKYLAHIMQGKGMLDAS